MAQHDEEIQRAIGRIEGALGEIKDKINALITNHIVHEDDDKRNFALIREQLNQRITEQNDFREAHLREQDSKLDAIQRDADKARGAGWVILGLLGSLAAFVGAAVISALNGRLHFH